MSKQNEGGAVSLADIQAKIKAPKGQFNNFGKYKYRSCEDILEAVKPVINEAGLHVTLSDEVELIGDRYYILATATLCNGIEILGEATAYAREAESKKGMDAAQVTGSASSYARKFALCGLFGIDDEKDADATNKAEQVEQKAQKPIDQIIKPELVEGLKKGNKNMYQKAVEYYIANGHLNKVEESYQISDETKAKIKETAEQIKKAKESLG